MRAVIPVKPVTTPVSKLTINPSLVMACGFACSSSAFIVPLHDSVRTSALRGKQINVKATNSIRDMATARFSPALMRRINRPLFLIRSEIFYTLREAHRSHRELATPPTTRRSGPMPQSDTSHQHERCSFRIRVDGQQN